MTSKRIIVRVFSLLWVLVLLTPAIAEEKKPVGTVSIDETQFALIIGGSTGGGILKYKGQEYPFKTGGLSIGASIGVSKVSLVGNVYDMTDVSQFPGTYRKFTASVALGGGAATLTLKNENGVIMDLSGTTHGLSVDVSAEGLSVTMK